MFVRAHLRYVIPGLVVLLAAACNSDKLPTSPGGSANVSGPAYHAGGAASTAQAAALSAVLAGNAEAITVAPALVPPGAPLAPFIEARLFAIANIAIHDALNAIDPRYERYADTGPISGQANGAAAVLTAAHDAIVGADPASATNVDAWYAGAIAAESGNPGFANGVAIGHRVAAAILSRRASDGTAGGGIAPYTPGTNPGDYQFTFPFNTPAFNFFGTGGFADASQWGTRVTPFVVNSTSQFRAPRPYGAPSNAEAVKTHKYTEDFNEVKRLGCAGCARTPDQTQIALFWVENSPEGFNRIARIVAADKSLDAWETARMLALLQMGQFDSYATNLESKYYYNFWRPVSAIALADNDGNPNTSSAADWQVLAFPTPPVPDYPSAHSGAGGAAWATIEGAAGKVNGFATTSGSLPGVTRVFDGLDDAAKENALSRVYVGFHFRHATEVGLKQGKDVGHFIVHHALRPLHGNQ